ncbi:MAG: GNAT family N-acetyltransferase [Cyanobacteria bacterium J06555_13]
MNIVVREYSNSDWETVCDIHDRARPYEIRSFAPGASIEPMAEVAEEDGFFDGQQFVACVNQQVVGFVCIENEELTWLYVSPDFHRQGIGRRLVEPVRPQLGRDGYVLTVLENTAAVKFYEQMGFTICAVFPGAYQNYPCTCVRFALPSSRHRDRPPTPVKESLLLSGFDDTDWGTAYRDPYNIWRWKRTGKSRPHEARHPC